SERSRWINAVAAQRSGGSARTGVPGRSTSEAASRAMPGCARMSATRASSLLLDVAPVRGPAAEPFAQRANVAVSHHSQSLSRERGPVAVGTVDDDDFLARHEPLDVFLEVAT